MFKSMSVQAQLKFLVPNDKYLDSPPIYFASKGGADANLELSGEFDFEQVDILNARQLSRSPSLETEGFTLKSQKTQVKNFFNDQEVLSVYENEITKLLGDETGANRVKVFDHTKRSDSLEVRTKYRIREPSKVVHNDYSRRSAMQRLRDFLPDEVDEFAKKRFAIINVWRPLFNCAETTPLALCDARTVDKKDLISAERRAADRVGELTLVSYNVKQRWMYYPRMTPNEVLLIKTWDTQQDGKAPFSVHGSFDDPNQCAGALHRTSIETRAFVFFS